MQSEKFKTLKEDIRAEASHWQGNEMGFDGIYIEDETPESILVYDYTDNGWEHIYRIWDEAAITKDWLKERIVVTPSLHNAIKTGALKTADFDMDTLVDWVFTHVPKSTFRTLNRLVFIYDCEDDYLKLSDITIKDWHADFCALLDAHELPDDGLLGITWSADCCCIINVKEHILLLHKMIAAHEIEDYEYDVEFAIGLRVSIAHEFRHLQQNDPWVSDEVFCSFLPDIEEDAETFGRECFEGMRT